VGAEIVQHDDVAWLEARREDLLDIGKERIAVHRASMTHGAVRAVERKPATKVVVFQWPCGILPTNRSPRGARPRSRALLVLVPVSSMKTNREGSNLA
jgi:hypothetical protein